jgi:cob(I)alamin adenosyltransferase
MERIQVKRKGLIGVFTGDGKGKTSAALGTALRAAGQGLRVLILQFMKRQRNIGELKAIRAFNLPIRLEQHGSGVFFKSRACEPMDIYVASLGMAAFKEAMESGRYEMIILDEINMAVHFGLVQWGDLKQLLDRKPPGLHVLLTGRNARPELIEMADMVTEMREVKHPFRDGVQAQAGIEY